MNTIVALYDTMEQARQAVTALKSAGYTDTEISLVANDPTGEYGREITNAGDGVASGATAGAIIGGIGGLLVGLGALVIPGIGPVLAAGPLAAGVTALLGAGIGAAAGGLLGALVDMGIPEDEAGYYAEGVRRGGALVTANVDDSRADKAHQILDGYNPVDINERAQTWQKEGWTGYRADAKPYTVEEIQKERSRYTNTLNTNMSKNLDKGGEVAIPVVEEKINIGKREVESGGVRVRKYVQERPVETDVTLRKEHVVVDRRPVDRAATTAMGDAFKEGTIEVTEKSEQAVINKEARVVEEVVVRKDVNQQTEKVRDTVRRTDVEVENMGNTGANAMTGYRAHYQKYYGSSGQKYDYYEPAYTYGQTLRSDKRYSNWDWTRLEPEARRTWEQRYPNTTWERIKDAVRYAWEGVKDAVS